MSDLAWKFSRLRVMTPAEIAHRANIALRDRFAPPAWSRMAPTEAFARLFQGDATSVLRTSRLGRLVRSIDATNAAAEVTAARALLERRWSLFGREVVLDDPPHWSTNPRSGLAWPLAPSASIDYHDVAVAGDPKDTWELGRLTMLPTLALAARVTGERAFADLAIRWLDDFTATQRLGRGIHHTAGIEQAMRVLTVTWTLALLGERALELKLEACLGLLAQQALHCSDHLSLGSSANNHLIAEYAAMTVAGAVFPALRDADTLLDQGVRGLSEQTLRQFTADGVHAEQSFGYLPFVWELLLLPSLASAAAGVEMRAEARARLRSSLEFARSVRLPGGGWPRVGDEDDARVLFAGDPASRLDLVGNALASWLGSDALDARHQGLARMLTGTSRESRAGAEGSRVFEGYTTWREKGLLVTFDHGPLGLAPLAAHGHADALGVTISRGDDELVLDPGTFSYHDDREARDRCRSTSAHATLHFGAESQARMRGAFLWEGVPLVHAVGDALAADAWWECRWSGGQRHRRRVVVNGDTVAIEDRVMSGTHAAISFPLAPGATVLIEGTQAIVRSGGSVAIFEGEGFHPWQLEDAEVAPRYGVRVAAPRLIAALVGEVCRTLITVGPGV
jgi:hypothetical protein